MSDYVVTFWRYADENQMPICVLSVQADSASHALSQASHGLYQAMDAFVQQGWNGDLDHVSIKKLNGKPFVDR